MDALSQAFVSVRASGAVFFRMECSSPWGFAVPNVNDAAELLSPGTGRIVNYHLVTEGRAFVRLDDGEAFWAEAGDVVILPHGDAHTVSSGHVDHYSDSALALRRLLSDRPVTLRLGSEDGEMTRIVCGFIGCEKTAERLFLSGLPSHLCISLHENLTTDWLSGSIAHLALEAEQGLPGSSILLSRMAEALFVEALRRFMQHLPAEQTGWLAAARDPMVGAVLALLHQNPARRWTLNDLAAEVGASRSVLTRRFFQLLDDTPANYLRRWRLSLAAERLRTSRDTILQIAFDVGYESEAAFIRAFKSEFTMPPAYYRRHIRDRSAT